MARRRRIQFPGARYHVFNRGNLRHDLFATVAWRKGLARKHRHLALAPGFLQSEEKELQSERWERALESALQESGRSRAELASTPKRALRT